ncbi:MAG: GDP-mannose 4,6-dehydratase [Deltaproteobacteria bacterium]|nr:GDP-mannose 4,6-dehydratase [Deltaproteobacteria bacterium]MBI2349328.1 GDP-mannose 4,6-dehydratase [Deltaproteobacteria bacterium]MBI2539805.1 GDP-mannose 4,6-dehydratase [Deltaproteobacteria bacterium]
MAERGVTAPKSYWEGRNVLVTGANGFLGSWVSKRLVEEGANVICFIRDTLPRSFLNLSGTTDKVVVAFGTLEDYFSVERVFNEFEVDFCFHLAAQAIVGTAERFPLSTYDSNIRGTWNVLEGARRNSRVRGLVLASSDKVYGSKEKLPYTEEDSLGGLNPYDVSKVCADLLAQSYFHTYRVPVAIARSGNFYGPGDLNFSRVVPETIRYLIRDESPVIRSDGSYLRDYFYVEDAAEAFLTLGASLSKETVKGQAFNFGTGVPTPVLDVVNQLIALSGKKQIKPVILNQAAHEIKAQYLSCRKAQELLGWRHATDLKKGLAKSYSWYEDFFSKDGS